MLDQKFDCFTESTRYHIRRVRKEYSAFSFHPGLHYLELIMLLFSYWSITQSPFELCYNRKLKFHTSLNEKKKMETDHSIDLIHR